MIDTPWFLGRLEELQITQRGLAKLIDLDHAAVNLMLHGKRKMSVDEAVALAVILRVPIDTLIARATGVPLASLRGATAATGPT